MVARPCVSVVIVSYNSSETIGHCLASLYESSSPWLERVIVVDNLSSDGSIKLLEEHYPDVCLIKNRTNLGFSKACNIGAALARGQYLLFLNPDAFVDGGTIPELVSILDARANAGCCGPVVYNQNGIPDPACRRGFPTPWNALGRLFYLERLFPSSRTISSYSLHWLGFEREATVDCVSGACLCIRSSDFEALRGFDEDFFLFGEDIDLCKRLANLGRETWFVPTSRVRHIGGHSMKQEALRANREFYHAMHLYMNKHWTMLPQWMFGVVQMGIRFRARLEKIVGH